MLNGVNALSRKILGHSLDRRRELFESVGRLNAELNARNRNPDPKLATNANYLGDFHKNMIAVAGSLNGLVHEKMDQVTIANFNNGTIVKGIDCDHLAANNLKLKSGEVVGNAYHRGQTHITRRSPATSSAGANGLR